MRCFLISILSNIRIYIFVRIDIKIQRISFKSKNDLKQKERMIKLVGRKNKIFFEKVRKNFGGIEKNL